MAITALYESEVIANNDENKQKYIMSKHTTTHLFFHLNDTSASSSNNNNTFSGARKPKRSTTATHELNPSYSFDYYDYFSNYGRFMSTPPISPSLIPRECLRERDLRYETLIHLTTIEHI